MSNLPADYADLKLMSVYNRVLGGLTSSSQAPVTRNNTMLVLTVPSGFHVVKSVVIYCISSSLCRIRIIIIKNASV